MKNKMNWFWGGFFILAAIFVIASQLGGFGEIGFASMLATVLLAAVLVKSVASREFFGIFICLALLYLIYQQPLGLMEISFWLLLLAAILLSIGFSFIFHNHHQRRICYEHGEWQHTHQTREDIDDNNPYARVSFGASSKYLHGDCLRSGQFSVSFGALELFFDQAVLSPEGAEIELDCSFGAIKLYVPRTWRVIDRLRTSIGGVDNDVRLARPEEDAPQLTVSGTVSMGGVEIHYI